MPQHNTTGSHPGFVLQSNTPDQHTGPVPQSITTGPRVGLVPHPGLVPQSDTSGPHQEVVLQSNTTGPHGVLVPQSNTTDSHLGLVPQSNTTGPHPGPVPQPNANVPHSGPNSGPVPQSNTTGSHPGLVPHANTTGPHTGPVPQSSTTYSHPGPVSQSNTTGPCLGSISQSNATGPYQGPRPESNATGPRHGPLPNPNKNYGIISVLVRCDETPNEERTLLTEKEQRPECAPSTSSDPTHSGAVDSKSTVVTGTISKLETTTEKVAGSAINIQHLESTPSSLSQEVTMTNTANETADGQRDLSDAVPSTTLPLEGQREPIVNQALSRGDTASKTAVAAAETVRNPAVLEESKFSHPSDIRDADGAEQDTASQGLSGRTTVPSTEPQQKVPEIQVLLRSSSKIKDGTTDAQVSN